ncbi:hypothetical protein FRC00_004118, partial [Tulasnella sp. 408]
MMKANPVDDSNALMAQSNAILMQIALGRNDTMPSLAGLPSNAFKPTRDVFAVNILFSLSLASALVSSFLAVLGRQWLVCYRKRSGGGPDRQRWEQLKRFLGAERWRLELILDDFLPSILQIGLVVFCISFGIYLHMLNPTLSYIVGIPMYVGLVFFVSSALCTLWDQFCPFQSPLSHLLSLVIPLTYRALSKAITFLFRTSQQVREDLWSHFRPTSAKSTFSLDVEFDPGPGAMMINAVAPLSTIPQPSIIKGGSEKDDVRDLQLTALKRAVCTSDDPATLLYAAANTLAIRDCSQLERLWGDKAFRERFLELCGSSDTEIALSAISQAFNDLAYHKYANLVDCNRVLHNMLQCAGHIVASEEIHNTIHIREKMRLLEITENAIRSPKLPGEVKQIGRKLRVDMVTTLLRSVRPRLFPAQPQTLEHLVDPLISYFVASPGMGQPEWTYHEDVKILELFYPLVRQTMIYLRGRLGPITPGDGGFLSDKELSDYNTLGKAFNDFVCRVA